MIPRTSHQWTTALMVVLGATLGQLRYPLAILAGGPLARAIRTYAHASQESAWTADIHGDLTAEYSSVGVLQWNGGNPLVPAGLRTSAFWSGWYQPAEVQKALLHSWRWWALCLPVVGFGVERYLWTHGASDWSARAAWKGDAAGVTWWGQAQKERRAWSAWLTAQAAALSVAGGLYLAIKRGK